MRHWIIVIGLLLGAACSNTTPAGASGATTDLRGHLAADVKSRAPTDDKAARHEHLVDVHGAKVKIVWYTWDDGPAKYLLSVHWEVATPAKGVALANATTAMNPTNAGTPAAIVETLPVQIKWTQGAASGTESGTVSVRISADGHAEDL